MNPKINSSVHLLGLFILISLMACYAEETSTPQGMKVGSWIVTRQDPPERVEWEKTLKENPTTTKKPAKDGDGRQQVVFDLSGWVRTKLAMKNFTVNLDQLSLPVFDFSRPYAYQLAVYVPVVYSLIGLGYFLAFLFPGSFGLARRSDSIFSGWFGSREDSGNAGVTTTNTEDQNNFDYSALEAPAYYADDYVDNAFQQADGSNGKGGNRAARRRNRNRRQNGFNQDYAATARSSSFKWTDLMSTAISTFEQWLTKLGTEERQRSN